MSLLAGLAPINSPASLPVGYINPPTNTIAPKVGAIGLGVLGLATLGVAVLENLGAGKWRDELIGKIPGNRSGNTSRPTGLSDLNSLADGQYELLRNDGQWLAFPLEDIKAGVQFGTIKFFADDVAAISAGWQASTGGAQTYFKSMRKLGSSTPSSFAAGEPVGTGFIAPFGLDFGDSKTKSPPSTKPITPPSLSPAIGWGNGKPVTNGVGAAVGLGAGTQTAAPEGLKTPPPPVTTPPPPTKNPDKTEEQKKKEEQEKKTEEQKRKEEQQKREEDKKKVPPPPQPNGDVNDVINRLIQIGAISALINTNTQPDAQRQNSKNGACDALNSPSCTKGVEDRIKEPLSGKLDAAQVARDAISANQIREFGLIAENFAKAKEFSEKVARAARLDKIYNFLTFITVIHNASMLSSSIATTLMDSLSLGLATFGIKDADESPINIQGVINKSVEDTVKSVVGAANYTVLSERWKNAVRVYQASANMLYQVRSLWDSARSLAELTGANVGRIGNALKKDGVVSENAYPAMADSPLMVNSPMQKLQNLEEAASQINSITSETYSVTETVAQIKKDKDDFDKLIKEVQPKPAIENLPIAQKIADSKTVSVSPNLSITDLAKPD